MHFYMHSYLHKKKFILAKSGCYTHTQSPTGAPEGEPVVLSWTVVLPPYELPRQCEAVLWSCGMPLPSDQTTV
jgi:hypothetical protein